jgi:two-component system, NarL family, sensor histidine kinase DesK
MREPGAPRRFPFLPPNNPYLGWTPYAWLIYLPCIFIDPVIQTREGKAGALLWAATILGAALFLVSYFRAFWARDRERLLLIAFQVALGLALSPANSGMSVFFIYAASHAGALDDDRLATRSVLAIAALGVFAAWWFHEPFYYWTSAAIFTPLIGFVNMHFCQVRRRDEQLRLAHGEIRHLAAVAERERIARDLHDVLGHTLSLIVLKSELASKLAERDPQRAAREIRDVEQVSRKTLQEVREAIRGYRASLADEIGRAQSMLAAASTEVRLDTALVTLPRAVDDVLAMALREGVTNVARHSGARRCLIRFSASDTAYALEVADDGRGGTVREGSGLRGMRERVEALGGTVTTTVKRGTRLVVMIPVGAQSADASAGAAPQPDAPPASRVAGS